MAVLQGPENGGSCRWGENMWGEMEGKGKIMEGNRPPSPIRLAHVAYSLLPQVCWVRLGYAGAKNGAKQR